MSRQARLVPLKAVTISRVFRANGHHRLSTSSAKELKNQVFDLVQNPRQLDTYKLDSSSSRRTLITLWIASFDPASTSTSRLLHSIVKSGVGEEEGGVDFCTVELDAADVKAADLGTQYTITSVPTLLSIIAERSQYDTVVTHASNLADRVFLEEWVRNEAARGKDDQDTKGDVSDSIKGLFLIDAIIAWFLP